MIVSEPRKEHASSEDEHVMVISKHLVDVWESVHFKRAVNVEPIKKKHVSPEESREILYVVKRINHTLQEDFSLAKSSNPSGSSSLLPPLAYPQCSRPRVSTFLYTVVNVWESIYDKATLNPYLDRDLCKFDSREVKLVVRKLVGSLRPGPYNKRCLSKRL